MTKNWTQLEKGDIKCNYICEFIPSTCYSAACKVQWTQGYTRHQDRVFYLRERRESHANSSKPERSFCACRITIKHRIVLYLSVDRISVLQRQERLAPARRVVFFVTSLWKLSYFKVRLHQEVKLSNILFPRLATIACAILVLLFLSTKNWIFLRIWYFPPPMFNGVFHRYFSDIFASTQPHLTKLMNWKPFLLSTNCFKVRISFESTQ